MNGLKIRIFAVMMVVSAVLLANKGFAYPTDESLIANAEGPGYPNFYGQDELTIDRPRNCFHFYVSRNMSSLLSDATKMLQGVGERREREWLLTFIYRIKSLAEHLRTHPESRNYQCLPTEDETLKNVKMQELYFVDDMLPMPHMKRNGDTAPQKRAPDDVSIQQQSQFIPLGTTQQKEFFPESVPQEYDPSASILQEDVLPADIPPENIQQKDVLPEDILQVYVPAENIMQKDFPAENISQMGVSPKNIPEKDVSPSQDQSATEAHFPSQLVAQVTSLPQNALQKEFPPENMPQEVVPQENTPQEFVRPENIPASANGESTSPAVDRVLGKDSPFGSDPTPSGATLKTVRTQDKRTDGRGGERPFDNVIVLSSPPDCESKKRCDELLDSRTVVTGQDEDALVHQLHTGQHESNMEENQQLFLKKKIRKALLEEMAPEVRKLRTVGGSANDLINLWKNSDSSVGKTSESYFETDFDYEENGAAAGELNSNDRDLSSYASVAPSIPELKRYSDAQQPPFPPYDDSDVLVKQLFDVRFEQPPPKTTKSLSDQQEEYLITSTHAPY